MMSYDPTTGRFVWLQRRGGQYRVGDTAGSRNTDGYWCITLDRRCDVAHHLAFLYMTGKMPAQTVDHINGDRLDNRWANLRQVSFAVNSQNRRVASNKKSCGLLGVTPVGRRWQAQLKSDGKNHYLGLFDTPEAAHARYLKAKRELHPQASPL